MNIIRAIRWPDGYTFAFDAESKRAVDGEFVLASQVIVQNMDRNTVFYLRTNTLAGLVNVSPKDWLTYQFPPSN